MSEQKQYKSYSKLTDYTMVMIIYHKDSSEGRDTVCNINVYKAESTSLLYGAATSKFQIPASVKA